MSSATGGYLQPVAAPIGDNALARVMHGLIAGVTGLSGSMVRKKWQRNMPAIPANGIDWCAFAIANVEAYNTYQVQIVSGNDTAMRQSQYEAFDLECSFYGDNCQQYAAMLRDGLHVAQNREAMYLAGIAVRGGTVIVHVPELINDQWQDRCDITIAMARDTSAQYDVLHFLGAHGSIVDDAGIEQDWATMNIPGIFDQTFDETFA